MTLLQAILLAMLYWLAAGEIFVPFTYCFCDLMLISLLTGVILGDPVKGCIVGGTIQRCIWHSLPLEALCRWTKKRPVL